MCYKHYALKFVFFIAITAYTSRHLNIMKSIDSKYMYHFTIAARPESISKTRFLPPRATKNIHSIADRILTRLTWVLQAIADKSYLW